MCWCVFWVCEKLGFNQARQAIEYKLNINLIKEFGTNYPEHYHNGESAIQKLINEAEAHKQSGAKDKLQKHFIVKN